ncbi:MAG: (2Fe-2S)-binding protein [Gemmatimonadota bacterium]|nr:(2Fe-2S)-binding protein [Gemmatimonadota bacterium]
MPGSHDEPAEFLQRAGRLPAARVHAAHGPRMKFTLNGTNATTSAHPMTRLLDVLREEYALTGTKEGCGEGECGACTVLVDRVPVCSCLIPLAQVEGTAVTTIEGLGGDHPLQHLFMNEIGAQCGICTPGMIMSCLSLGDAPTLDDVKTAIAGNLCRCTGYSAIFRAVLKWKETGRNTSPNEMSRGAPSNGRAE